LNDTASEPANEDCSAVINDSTPKDLTNPYPVGGGTCSDVQYLTEDDCTEAGETWAASESTVISILETWFYRDSVSLSFSEMNPAISVSGTNSNGDVAIDFEWNDARDKVYLIPASGSWSGDESYELTIDFCGSSAQFDFSTSLFGAAMDSTPSDLEGNVYKIDLAQAEYSTPQGIDIILGNNITQPLLFGVRTATESAIDFIAKLGDVAENAEITPLDPLWVFPNAIYSAPYFEATAESIEVEYPNGSDVIGIAIYNFNLSGTFAPDGNKIGGAIFSGLGDTSDISSALYSAIPNSEGKLCEDVIPTLSDGAGGNSECVACPGDTSGSETCVFLAGEIEVADIINPNLLTAPLE
jgi:hypothetical protein